MIRFLIDVPKFNAPGSPIVQATVEARPTFGSRGVDIQSDIDNDRIYRILWNDFLEIMSQEVDVNYLSHKFEVSRPEPLCEPHCGACEFLGRHYSLYEDRVYELFYCPSRSEFIAVWSPCDGDFVAMDFEFVAGSDSPPPVFAEALRRIEQGGNLFGPFRSI